jgi:outer membrane protein insertion porin family
VDGLSRIASQDLACRLLFHSFRIWLTRLLVQEYAGLPGSSESVNFLKSTAQSQLSRALSPGSGWVSVYACPRILLLITRTKIQHYSISSLTTMLIPLNASRTSTQLPDRVFLGGPNSIRGWKIGGIGARDGCKSHGSHARAPCADALAADSLGGDLAWALGVSMFAPFPTKKEWPVKLHGFLNTGRVVGWESGESLSIMCSLATIADMSIARPSAKLCQQCRPDVQLAQHECRVRSAVQA